MQEHAHITHRRPLPGGRTTVFNGNEWSARVDVGGAARITVAGRLVGGRGAAPAPWDLIRALVAGHDVILELAGACQVDAAGLGILADLRRHVSAGDNTLTVVAQDSRVRRLLALVGLPRLE